MSLQSLKENGKVLVSLSELLINNKALLRRCSLFLATLIFGTC